MEPIDLLGALRRSWRLLLTLAIIGVVVAVLVPVNGHKAKKHSLGPDPWSATTLVGAPPPQANTVVGGGADGQQILFYAEKTSVQEAAAKRAHLHIPSASVGSFLKASLNVPKGLGKREQQNVSEVVLSGKGSTTSGPSSSPMPTPTCWGTLSAGWPNRRRPPAVSGVAGRAL